MRKDTPRFYIPVRPLEVPDKLRALPPDDIVWRQEGVPASCGVTVEGPVTAAYLVASIEETIARQGQGRFLVSEAAFLIAEAQGFDARKFRDRMEAAFKSGRLDVREPGSELTKDKSENFGMLSDIVYEDDINNWLAQKERVSYRFPATNEAPVSAPDVVRPGQVSASQDKAILSKLIELGFNPMRLEYPKGKESPAKSAIRSALPFSHEVVNKSWKRLSRDGLIKNIST